MADKPKLTRAERKQIEAVIRKYRGDGKPHTAQDTIPYQIMYPDGICYLGNRRYSQSIEFFDINYLLAQPDDQTAIFEYLCDLYNYLDSSIHVQFTYPNRKSNREQLARSFEMPPCNDGLDPIRQEQTDILKRQLARGNNGSVKTKYITYTIEADNLKAARARLSRISLDIQGYFKIMGAVSRVLDGKERLEVLHGIMHPDGERFNFDWKWLAAGGLSTKDFIAPSSFAFKNSRMFQMGGKLCAASFLQIITPELTDRILTDFLDTDSSLVVNVHIQALEQTEAVKMVKRKITDLDAMKIQEQKKAVRDGYDMLENGETLTPEQTAYFHAVLAHVDACREKLNAGDYHLPDPPQLSDFDKELQDYKAHVESEIAQEAEAAGMTVEEYAANGYEPQEQPTDVQEQPEEAPPADAVPEQTAVRYYTINEGAARRANDANSYRDYAAGSATAEYRQMVDQAAAIAQRQKERVDPMYHEKIDALLDTYARKLAENLNDHYAIEARVPSILVAGGSNFPVRKKEKQNAARDRNMQEWQDVQGILDKIRSTGMGGISMDDPQAAAKLEAKLVKLESAQETMKAVNAYFRKHKTLEGCPSLTPEQISKLQQEMSQSWHLDKIRPYPAYMLSNNNAEIRRIRGRIEQVRQHEETNFAGWEFDGGRVEANKADNRLQVFFDGKPDEAARDELKANGFRWAPSVGAWQRQLNKNAYYAAGYISCIQPISGEKPIDVQRSAQQQESAVPDGHLTGERVSTPRGSFHVANMSREQMEAAGYGYHHITDDGKYLIMGNGTQAFAIAAEQREQENYMRTAELSTEQNCNMIDGQINNTPSVDELEEKAKRGEVISLSALAAAVKAEDGRTPQRDPDGKKPSIRAQLKANRAQSCKPQQREKEQEAKRSIRQASEME
ncbi:MAG: DUF4316 domain-containing protein [Faecalibacterium prausnitzii]